MEPGSGLQPGIASPETQILQKSMTNKEYGKIIFQNEIFFSKNVHLYDPLGHIEDISSTKN